MTGAPKKRSVEILQQLEAAERGIYSGVLGYADVGGGGDWAVAIRSCFKHDEHVADSQHSAHPLHNTADVSSDLNGSRCHRDDALHKSPSQQTPLINASSGDKWTLGAGGAITALSDPVAEWEEMITKVESVLRAFGDLSSC